MPKYLLICACGNTNPVDVGQAGGRIVCSCGAQLDVPTLRQLRHLPQEKVEEKSTGAAWDTRQGWIAATLIVAVALLAWSAWSWWSQPKQPKFVAEEHMATVDQYIAELKPVDAWERWIGFYRPLSERGLMMFHASNAAQIHTKIAEARFLRGMLLTIAGVFAVIAAAIAFWPRPVAAKTRRPGDKETRR